MFTYYSLLKSYYETVLISWWRFVYQLWNGLNKLMSGVWCIYMCVCVVVCPISLRQFKNSWKNYNMSYRSAESKIDVLIRFRSIMLQFEFDCTFASFLQHNDDGLSSVLLIRSILLIPSWLYHQLTHFPAYINYVHQSYFKQELYRSLWCNSITLHI